MNTALPDIDPMLAATDPAAMADFNRQLITEFRSNAGTVGGQLAGMPVLLVTTVGARTGRSRVIPLGYVPHPDGFVVAASKSGAPTHPAWYHNLLAAPNASVEVGADTVPVRAVVTHGHRRARLYEQLTAVWPMQADYQANTSREIPVLILQRRS